MNVKRWRWSKPEAAFSARVSKLFCGSETPAVQEQMPLEASSMECDQTWDAKSVRPLEKPPAQAHLQSVVIGIGGRFQLIDAGEMRVERIEGPPLLKGLDGPGRRLIDIAHAEQLRPFGSDITHLQNGALDKGLLHVEVVALNVRRAHVRVHAEHGEGRHRRVGAAEDIHARPEGTGTGEVDRERSEAGHGIGADVAVGEALRQEEILRRGVVVKAIGAAQDGFAVPHGSNAKPTRGAKLFQSRS